MFTQWKRAKMPGRSSGRFPGILLSDRFDPGERTLPNKAAREVNFGGLN